MAEIILAVVALIAFATLVATVQGEYAVRTMVGLPIPRWLATLELLREYLASEDGPEVRRRARRRRR